MGISVILNGYRRGHRMKEQYEAIMNQTVKPSEVMLWYNNPGEGHELNYELVQKIPSAVCNVNLGVWARFAFAFMARQDTIAVFDDDTIPGRRWLENCVETMKTREGLLGTVGLLYLDPPPADSPLTSYNTPYEKIGWVPGGRRDHAVEVDFVGHSWFFRKEWLSVFWREQPPPKYAVCGEDMHFSFMLQKYAGLKTYVPPHPENRPEEWGSVKGDDYGSDAHSIWRSNRGFKFLMNDYFIEQRKRGWKLVQERRR